MIKRLKNLSYVVLAAFLLACSTNKSLHPIKINKEEDMQDFFAYRNDGSIIISGHRGGMAAGFPENSIEAMEETLRHLPAFFEIDPRYTKDSVIVLMHDADISRTTTGEGKLSSYTWEELKQFKLKDREGNVTPYSIPTLEDVIEWSKGKTILNLDRKDVPIEKMASFLKELKTNNVMLTVHSPEQALYYYNQNKNAMFSAFMRNMEEYQAYEGTGIPWSQFIAYVGPKLKSENEELYRILHEKGIRYMISLAPNYDKVENVDERNSLYKESIETSPDIIESDFPIEVHKSLQELKTKK